MFEAMFLFAAIGVFVAVGLAATATGPSRPYDY